MAKIDVLLKKMGDRETVFEQKLTDLKESNATARSIEISGHRINLDQIKIPFMPNDEQIQALEGIATFLKDSNRDNYAYTLEGYAGTGKTAVTKILLKWIRLNFGYKYQIEVTAPTNRAKYIIESLSGQKAKTIHSILGLVPNIEIEKLDARNLKFELRKMPSMPSDLLIIDETSLVNDTLLAVTLEKASAKGCKVLFIGDSAQLKPVKQAHISKVFTEIPKVCLTKVERQKDGNPLGPILLQIRNNIHSSEYMFDVETIINSSDEGLLHHGTSSSFLEAAEQGLRQVAYYGSYLHSRILTYTNDRMQLYNNLMRDRLKFTNELTKGELLMGYANVGNSDYADGLVNSNDYIIENDPKLVDRNIGDVAVKGYWISLVSTDLRTNLQQFYVSKEFNDPSIFGDIGYEVENLRLEAKHTKNKAEASDCWKRFYSIKDSFVAPLPCVFENRIIIPKSVDFGYAMTTHKSQGGTFTNAYVDARDIDSVAGRDIEMRNQLLYVAMSRCTQQVHLFS